MTVIKFNKVLYRILSGEEVAGLDGSVRLRLAVMVYPGTMRSLSEGLPKEERID